MCGLCYETMNFKNALLAATTCLALGFAVYADELADKSIGYMDFATYDAGIILPQQLSEEVLASVTCVDMRDAEHFESETNTGSVNIEWREIPSRIEELPEDCLVVLFCNAGSLSAQAIFAARLLGRENVLVLQTGMKGWMQDAAYRT